MMRLLWLLLLFAFPARAELSVGSKAFTESVILGEIATLALTREGIAAGHRDAMGGTRVLFAALAGGEIDVYPDYTGTLRFEIFAGRSLPDRAALADALAERGIGITAPLGFANNYALAMRSEQAEKLGITAISDLKDHPGLQLGFSNEFIDRKDGWPGLKRAYGLPHTPNGLQHDLAYRGLDEGKLDVIDAYTTDAEIAYYGLTLLEDDRGHFPSYEAVFLYRLGLEREAPGAVESLKAVAASLDAERMQALNKAVKIDGRSESAVAAEFLSALKGEMVAAAAEETVAGRIQRRTLEHLTLVAVSLGAAIALAIPLGIAAQRFDRAGGAILASVGILQTIPALALFVFMIPLLGIGAEPTIAALFLYSLLPIVRNTHAGLAGIDGELRETALALGLPGRARLWRIELPLALPTILAGIKTAAVINVGAATLGALIGAGGLGQPILTGIRLDDIGLILQGAVPAALLALAVTGLFELFERWMTPRGLTLEGPPR